MPHPRFNGEDIARRGEELYQSSIRAQVETSENIGRLVFMDIETGAYEVGDDLVSPGKNLQLRHPEAAIYAKRIGYNAALAVGGTLTRTEP